ncbi:MAG: hypothetical protein ACC662_02015, partial [Planctomycetota bacterium]
ETAKVYVELILDASGSMARRTPSGATRWATVTQELTRALERLGPARGNVFRFADEVESVFPRSELFTRARRRAVAQWLAGTEPGGRTALFDGVAAALADPDIDQVVVLSDGAPSAGSFFTKTDLLTEIGRRNRWRRARIDVVAVGADGIARRWRDVLRRLADASGGTCVQR